LKCFFLFLVVFIIPDHFIAQPAFRNPVVIDMDDGLPSNYITSIAKDNEGFMWFGTDKGLCRWDGITALTFEHNGSDSTSIADNSIELDALLWDEEHQMLLIGTNKGLSVYDPLSGKFRNFYPGKGSLVATGNQISAIIKDRQGIFWLATDNGLVKFEYPAVSMKNYYYRGDFKTEQLIDTVKVNTMLSVSQDLNNDSVFWIGTKSGLLKFNKYTEAIERFYYHYDPENIEYTINIFRSVCPHPNGKLYLGTWTSGMSIFDTRTGSFLTNFRPGGGPGQKGAYDGTNPPIKVKSGHEIWLPTVTALTIYDTEKDAITFSISNKNPAGNTYPIWLNLIDEAGRYWCGSRYGVYLFDRQNQQFDNYFFKYTDNTKTYITWDIFEDVKTGIIFLAEQGADGLHYFDIEMKQFSYLPLPLNSMEEASINSIYQANNGKIWIVCPFGLFNLSANRKTIIPFLVDEKDFPWFQEMAEDKDGNAWICSLSNGIQRIDLVSGHIENVKPWKKYFESDRNVPDLLHIHVDHGGRIWFNRRWGGYGYYDPKEDSIHYFRKRVKDDTCFFIVNCFETGRDNIIWAGDQEKGLGYIDPDFPEKGIQSGSSAKNRLHSNKVYNMRADKKDRLWMLTGAGLEMFDPATGNTALYKQEDGFIMFDTFANRQSYNPGSLEILYDGRMAVGYRRGVGFFHPDSLVSNTEIPVPYLNSVMVFEDKLQTGTSLFYTSDIELKYWQNFLTFEYSAIAPTAGGDANFYHQLEGVDRDWVESQRRFASYSNLAPGDYTFRIKARTAYNLWSDKPVALCITIHPPWWKTWWAYILYVLAFAISFIAFYRFQINRQLMKRETSRLKEMDDIKSRLYANITHEFRTPLTVITGMTDEIRSALKPGGNERIDKFLDLVKRNAGKLLHLVNQMLDLSKLENGLLELKLIKGDVVPYVQYITESFQSFAESKGIKLVFYNEPEKLIMDYDPDKLFTIVSNMISNAIKFTRKGGKVICHLKKSVQGGQSELMLNIRDTGIGIAEAELPNIFDRFYQVDGTSTRKGEGTGIGLSLVKELVELMNGSITVKSIQGKGSEFTVRIPITRKAPFRKVKTKAELIETEMIKGKINDLPAGLHDDDPIEPGKHEETDYPITLIIEDNEDVANYISICLGQDYRVRHAANGSEGIDLALKLIPDIIICDVMMPEKDGFEVCSFLKQDERTSHIPVIMLTAKAGRDDRLAGLQHGADAYLTKPFDKQELLIRIQKMIEIRRSIREKFSKNKEMLRDALSAEGIEDLFLRKAIINIENNLDNSDFGTLQLARQSGMSESQLYRKLKALTGKSTALFIRSVRLQKARELLKTTSLNVSEIAYMTGFNDPAWFSRVFREEFGKSPGGVRGKKD
jgi:signal transduction histidine kinase/DNA-binding response OmpR family regulator/ligand-binding sensor domain-containing protein